MPSNFKALAGAAGGGDLADPNFKNVTLLLHGDGSNGAQNNTFIDSSTNNFTITRNGNTTQGSFSPYGSNWSNYFDGSGDYLTAGNNSAFAFGTGDFTVETWVFPTVNTGGFQIFFDTRNGGGDTAGIVFTIYNNQFGVYRGSLRAFGSVTFNQWTHYAVTRSGGTMRAFINGTQVDTWTDTATLSSDNSVIGMTNETGNYFNGYLSNLRVLKGTALYTSNFTPSTTPLTAITNTSLLTCAYNRFRDGSTNNFTITRNGDVKVTNFAPFAPSSEYSTTTNGGSAYFDGSGDYLTLPDNASLELGSSDITIEMWINTTNSTQYSTLYSRSPNSFTSGDWTLLMNNSSSTGGEVGLYVANYSISSPLLVTSGVSVRDGAWHHIAVVRNGSSWTIYIDGVSRATATWSGTVADVSSGPWIGKDQSFNRDYVGYISNLRFVKGTAVYTAAFTPPTSPLTAVTNTQLLTNFTNAAIFDNSMKNDLETVGNAQISTSVKKFGTGSMYFDGTGDYLKPPANTALDVSSGDFTIEAWVYKASNGNYQSIYSNWNDSNSGGVLFCMNGLTPTLLWRPYDIATGLVTGPTISSNTWTHVAVVRSGNSFTIYTNGTGGTSATYSTNSAAVSQYFIGAYGDGSSGNFNGYLDEIRVTKAARYTSNFTAPTAPFPNK